MGRSSKNGGGGGKTTSFFLSPSSKTTSGSTSSMTSPLKRKKKKSKTRMNLQEKAQEINLCLLEPDVNLWKLREFALSEGGLVNDTLRKRAWPKLVGLHKYYHPSVSSSNPASSIFPTLTTANSQDSIALLGSASADEQPQFEIDASVLNSQDRTNQAQQEFPVDDLIVQSMDVEQIERDVARCTWHLLTGTQRYRRAQYNNKHRKKVASLLRKKQRRLANLINLTLVESYGLAPSEDDRLRYYQGYHDVACIFLQALGGGNSKPTASSKKKKDNGESQNGEKEDGGTDDPNESKKQSKEDEEDPLGLELPARVLCQVSHSHFRDCLRSNFLSLQTALKLCLYPLLYKLDRKVHHHLRDCDMEPFFCLSWVLTWFSHDVRDTQVVKRLFDAFLVSHPLLPLYVSIAMMLHPINRRMILNTDCDFAALHQCLAMLPRNSCKVGWKQRWDGSGGYESDEGGEGPEVSDDRTESTDMDSSYNQWDSSVAGSASHNMHPSNSGSGSGGGGGSLISGQYEEKSMSLISSSTLHTSNDSVSSSVVSFSVGPISIESAYDRVPFQKLIDKALDYMKKYPPRSLLSLAEKYYKEEWQFDSQDAQANISFFKNPPSWSLAATAKADWVLKQRVRQDLGLKAMSRRDRRKKSKYQRSIQNQAADKTPRSTRSRGNTTPSKAQNTGPEDATPLVDEDYLAKNQRSRAVIAAGCGPDPDSEKERRRKRKQQKRMIAGAVAVSFLAIMFGVIYHRSQSTPTAPPTKDSATSTSRQNSTRTRPFSKPPTPPDLTIVPDEKVNKPATAWSSAFSKLKKDKDILDSTTTTTTKETCEAPSQITEKESRWSRFKPPTNKEGIVTKPKVALATNLSESKEKQNPFKQTATKRTIQKPSSIAGTIPKAAVANGGKTQTIAQSMKGMSPSAATFQKQESAAVPKESTSTHQGSPRRPLSSEHFAPLRMIEKMTLTACRFFFHFVFRPFGKLTHRGGRGNDTTGGGDSQNQPQGPQKGVFGVFAGGMKNLFRGIGKKNSTTTV